MRANDRGVHDRTSLVDPKLKRLEHRRPDPTLRPVRESVVDRLPRAEALWKIAPRDTGLCLVEHRIYEEPLATLPSGASFALRQDRLETLPLLVGQCMSAHDPL